MLRHYKTPLLLVETTKSLAGTASHARPVRVPRRDSNVVPRVLGRERRPERPLPSQVADKAARGDDASTSKPDAAKHDSSRDDADDLYSTRTVQARLALLAMHYPRLRFLWADDDVSSADLFLALKRGRADPDLAHAAKIGTLDDDDDAYGGRNQTAIDLLLRLPGVNDKNVRAVLERVDTLADLADLDVADLKPLLGPHNAKLLHAFFRRPNDLFKPTPATGRGYDPRLNREPAS